MTGEPDSARWRTLAAYALLVAYVVVRELGNSAYDDSYFFKRFALHAVEHGVYAWNLGDGPVHGSTSQLFQLLTTPIVLLTKTHFVAAVRVLDGVFLVLTAAVLLRRARAPWVLLAMGNALVLSAVRSNMETALALAVLSVALVRELQPARGTAMRNDLGSAAATVLVYLARPDAALIVGVVALLRRRWEGQPWVPYVLLSGAMMATLWATLWAYYGTALPLSFHIKALGLHSYGPHVSAGRWREKTPHLLAFGLTIAPLVWVLVRARVWRTRDATLALTLGAAAFVVYHALGTHEIMGYRARFYVPALVPLCLATSRAWVDAAVRPARAVPFLLGWVVCMVVAVQLGWAPSGEGFFLTMLPWPTYAMLVGAVVLAVSWPGRPLAIAACLLLGTALWIPLDHAALRSDTEVLHRHDREVTTARGIGDVARCLPPGSTVYHSEMGVPGLALYRMRVVDLAGLLSTDIALHGLRFQERCSADRPEAIFLPHKNYQALNAEITATPCFADYVRVVQRSSSPLYVRSDLAAAFLACGTEYREWR